MLVSFCSSYKDMGDGSVTEFSGKRIIGVLAGPAETANVNNKKAMDTLLQKYSLLQWFEHGDYGDDPCSPFNASGASCDAPAPTDGPGPGTTPAAMSRRVGRQPTRLRGSAMLVRPRLLTRFAGFRLYSLV